MNWYDFVIVGALLGVATYALWMSARRSFDV